MKPILKSIDMKITYYLYNAFTIAFGETKIAIDPGNYMKLFNMHSLIKG